MALAVAASLAREKKEKTARWKNTTTMFINPSGSKGRQENTDTCSQMPEFRPILQSMAAEMFRRITAATHSEQPKDVARPALTNVRSRLSTGRYDTSDCASLPQPQSMGVAETSWL